MPERCRTLGILIAYHNERHLLQRCLDSIFKGQQVFPDEVIVYDDASEYPAKDYVFPAEGLTVVRGRRNLGEGGARTKLLELSRSEYVHFQDPDDALLPGWTEKVSRVIDKKAPDIILTDFQKHRDGRIDEDGVRGLREVREDDDLVRFVIKVCIAPNGTTFRRCLGVRIGGYRSSDILPRSPDFDFHVRLAAVASCYSVIKEPLILQNIRPDSLSRDTSNNLRLICSISVLKALKLLQYDIDRKYFPDLADKAALLGSQFFNAGEVEYAADAFALAKQLGLRQYGHPKRLYRFIARQISPLAAEYLAKGYRTIVPESWRVFLNGFRFFHNGPRMS